MLCLLFGLLLGFVTLFMRVFSCSENDLTCNQFNSDIHRNTNELIESRGFEAQMHYAVTEDGYIITMHRIANPFNRQVQSSPVLLQHGLCASSACFLFNAPGGNAQSPRDPEIVTEKGLPVGNNLGFELSNLGYDVWLADSRGNTYSRNHTTLDPERDADFWKFSVDEMAIYDLPAVIDYILIETNRTSLAFVGHSQGALTMFALLSTRLEYNDKIKPFISLGPVTSLAHIKSPLRALASIPQIDRILRLIGGAFMPRNRLVDTVVNLSCDIKLWPLCKSLVFGVTGFNQDQFEKNRLPVYAAHFPEGTSIQTMAHYGQLIKYHRFARFDFGAIENINRYGETESPVYRIDRITSQYIALIYSRDDWLADYEDVEWLIKQLTVPLFDDYLVPDEKWNHLDFILGRDSGILINTHIVKVLVQSKVLPSI